MKAFHREMTEEEYLELRIVGYKITEFLLKHSSDKGMAVTTAAQCLLNLIFFAQEQLPSQHLELSEVLLDKLENTVQEIFDRIEEVAK